MKRSARTCFTNCPVNRGNRIEQNKSLTSFVLFPRFGRGTRNSPDGFPACFSPPILECSPENNMRSIPPSMKSELGEWNGGKGIDLESWISCSGSVKLAVGYAEYFWPELELVEGYIVRSGTTVDTIRQWEQNCGNDRRAIESTLNHMHLIDINYHDHENRSEDLLQRLGAVLTEIYDAKLKWQFPDRPCTVSLLIPDDPLEFDAYQVTFWQKVHEEQTKAEQTGAQPP